MSWRYKLEFVDSDDAYDAKLIIMNYSLFEKRLPVAQIKETLYFESKEDRKRAVKVLEAEGMSGLRGQL